MVQIVAVSGQSKRQLKIRLEVGTLTHHLAFMQQGPLNQNPDIDTQHVLSLSLIGPRQGNAGPDP